MLEKPVIVNNSPLVHLLTLNHLSLLRALYTEVWIPQEVKDEFLATDPEVREDALKMQHGSGRFTAKPRKPLMPRSEGSLCGRNSMAKTL